MSVCYPADHYDGVFIPNWAMWFVLELGEYAERTSDRELVARAREKVYALLDYFRRFENELGLPSCFNPSIRFSKAVIRCG